MQDETQQSLEWVCSIVSRLLELINSIKGQANERMLTSSQRTAFADLINSWRYPGTLNLTGPTGCGKTFLGWIVARHFQASFYAVPGLLRQDLPLYSPAVIIDNSPTEEKEVRRILSEIQLRQIKKTVLITSKPIRLGFPIIELGNPTTEDIQQFYNNLRILQHFPTQPISTGNLWQVIYSVIKEPPHES